MEMFTIERQQRLKDGFGLIFFVVAVIVGAWLINSLVFRSFSVSGPSMETTMYTHDQLVVNRLPMTWAALRGDNYTPSRGHVIVFLNPRYEQYRHDRYVVKRVIGLPGERVVVQDGKVTVYNKEHPEGLDPYDGVNIPKTAVTGDVDRAVGDDEIFVIGDNRSSYESLDSRDGLGTIPLRNIVGPVAMRIYPFDKISTDF